MQDDAPTVQPGPTPEKRRRPYVRPSTTNPIATDARQGAAMIGISPRSFRGLVKKGDITPIQVPGMRRQIYDVNELRSLVQGWKKPRP